MKVVSNTQQWKISLGFRERKRLKNSPVSRLFEHLQEEPKSRVFERFQSHFCEEIGLKQT